MKKFYISLLIVAIFSAAVFYIGWTQFKVKPGQVGLVISKTDGVDDLPVINGQYSWHWQFLLPTNAQLKCFDLNPLNCEKTVSGSLPSGQTYTSMFSGADSFDYSFTFSISLSLSEENLVNLYKANKISNQEDLGKYMSSAADSLAQLAANYYLQRLQANPDLIVESIRRDDILRNVKFYEDCPEFDVMTFALKNSKVPDFTLYKRLQNSYLNNQNSTPLTNNNLESLQSEEEIGSLAEDQI